MDLATYCAHRQSEENRALLRLILDEADMQQIRRQLDETYVHVGQEHILLAIQRSNSELLGELLAWCKRTGNGPLVTDAAVLRKAMKKWSEEDFDLEEMLEMAGFEPRTPGLRAGLKRAGSAIATRVKSAISRN